MAVAGCVRPACHLLAPLPHHKKHKRSPLLRTTPGAVKHKFDKVRGDPKAPANDGFMKITARAANGVITSARVRPSWLGTSLGGAGGLGLTGGARLWGFERLLCLRPEAGLRQAGSRQA